MKFSTTTRSVFSLLALFFSCCTSLVAQGNYNLQIDAPGSIAGTYLAVPFSSFGSADYCGGGEYSGELIIAEDATAPTADGCEAITNDLTGKIALVDRGLCNFSVKAMNVQNQGAIGVIICQNVTDPPFAGAAGTGAADVTIPVFMISKADCDLIRVEVPNGVEINLTPAVTEIPGGINVLWGGAGAGDFDGSLGDWTINNISCGDGSVPTIDLWRWAAEGTISGGGYGGGQIQSASSCNGAAYFYSDFYDNNGTTTQGSGPCIANQEGTLVSPSIDISGLNVAGVSLLFYQSARHFTNSDYFVEWSNDGGNNWTSIPINTDFVVNTVTYNEWLTIPLPGAAGSSDLQVRFRHIGDYYYWIVDDVMLIEQEANNMRVNSNFFAIPQNAMFPAEQNDRIHFLADIENIGAEEQTDVLLDVTITEDASGDEVFNTELEYGDVPANTIVENYPFIDGYTPNEFPGSYTGVYTISQNEDDFDESNDTQTFHFQISDSTFAKELGSTRDISPAAGNWDATETKNWGYGNCYFIKGRDDFFANSLSFGIGNAADANMIGKSVRLTLYYWLDSDPVDGMAAPNEVAALGQEFYGIVGTETDADIITVRFGETEPAPIALEDDGMYIAMIDYIKSDPTDPDLMLRASDDFDYSAMNFLTDTLEQLGEFTERFASMLRIDAALDDQILDPVGFGFDVVPVVRINVTPFINAVTNPLPDDNIVSIFPNPAGNSTTLKMDFVNAQKHVQLQLLNANGGLLMDKTLDNITKSNLPLNLSGLSSGTYSIRVITADGVRTVKFVVAK